MIHYTRVKSSLQDNKNNLNFKKKKLLIGLHSLNYIIFGTMFERFKNTF